MRKRQQTRRTFEALENRALLTSNVTASVDGGGNLFVTGVGGADNVFMQATKSGGWQIQGVKTKINGFSKLVTPLVTGNITVNLGDGKNLLEIQDSTIPGNLSITTGNQQDQISIWDLKINGSLTLSAGGGNDNLWIFRVNVDPTAGPSLIDMGAGNDIVSVNQSSAPDMTINLGAGKDGLKITDAQFLGGSTQQLTVLGGTERDAVSLNQVQTVNLNVDMGDGSVAGASAGDKDSLALSQVTAVTANFWDSYGTRGSISGSKDNITNQMIDIVPNSIAGFTNRGGDLKANKP